MTRYKVQGESGLVRDARSGAIVSVNKEEARRASAQRRLGRLPAEVDRLREQVEMLTTRLELLESKT